MRVKTDHRFRKRYILRTTISVVPPLIAFAFVWRDWGRFGVVFWIAAVFFLAWIAVWIILDAVMLRAYRCPSCGRRTEASAIQDRNAGDPLRYHCSQCDIEWDTGLREASD
jgi:predicted RNA-binding Zn-ribbon protein involved in translation (DUF1610 family)